MPVPDDVLLLGPDDPTALGWLWANWGTTEPLRHVTVAGAAARHAGKGADQCKSWQLSFWSADWTPWRALGRIRLEWPTLRFDVRPTYDDR